MGMKNKEVNQHWHNWTAGIGTERNGICLSGNWDQRYNEKHLVKSLS